jgi:hypothetical protein
MASFIQIANQSFLASIQSIKFGGGSLDEDLIQNLREKVHALITTDEFRQYLSESLPQDPLLNFKISITSKSIRIIKSDQTEKVFTLEKMEKETLFKAKEDLVERVKSLYLVQRNKIEPPHGIDNDTGNSCFAISAYQLASHVRSLKGVKNSLKGRFAPLKNYEEIAKGSQIISCLDRKHHTTRKGHDVSEVLTDLIESTSSYPTFQLHQESTATQGEITIENHKSGTHPQNLRSWLEMNPGNQTSANFQDKLKAALCVPESKVLDEERKTSYKYKANLTFDSLPSSIRIVLTRRAENGRKLNTKITDIPLELDLSSYTKERKKAKPYLLEGFSVHSGSGDEKGVGGHFYSYFMKEMDGKRKWFVANDSDLKEISIRDPIFKKDLENSCDLFYSQSV